MPTPSSTATMELPLSGVRRNRFTVASSRTVRLCGRQQPPRRHRPPPQRNYFGARARRVTSAEVRRSTAQSRRWLTTAPGGPAATDSRLPAAGQSARAVDSSRQRTRIWGRRAPQQQGRFECDERMGAPVISPVASLAHYCTWWTACNRFTAASSPTVRSCGRQQPPAHSHMGAAGTSAARPFRV